MGYLLHHTIVVSETSADRLKICHALALEIFKDFPIVSPIVPHAINGGAAFFIAPDGSKEGWVASDDAATCRKQFIEQLPKLENCFPDWAMIILGGDAGIYEIEDHA